MLAPMLKCELSALNDPYNLLYIHCKKDSKLRRFKHQTQIPFREENIYEKQEHSTNIMWSPLQQSRGRFSNMASNRHKNAYQELWWIYQNTWKFSNNLLFRIIRINGVDYLYNLYSNFIEIEFHIISSEKTNFQSLLIIIEVE